MKVGDLIHHLPNSKDGLFIVKVTPGGTKGMSFGYFEAMSLANYKWRPVPTPKNFYPESLGGNQDNNSNNYVICNYFDIPKDQRKSLMRMLKTDKETAEFAIAVLKTYKK